MTIYYRKGEAIEAKKVFYCFGRAPNSAAHIGGQYVGTFQRKGYARVTVRVRRAPPGSEPFDPDEIQCVSARFACDKRPRLPGKKEHCTSSDTCRTGYLKGSARVKIQRPYDEHL